MCRTIIAVIAALAALPAQASCRTDALANSRWTLTGETLQATQFLCSLTVTSYDPDLKAYLFKADSCSQGDPGTGEEAIAADGFLKINTGCWVTGDINLDYSGSANDESYSLRGRATPGATLISMLGTRLSRQIHRSFLAVRY